MKSEDVIKVCVGKATTGCR